METNYARFMREAIELAKAALAMGEVPVGAIVVKDGQIIARAHNEVEAQNDATAHAELLAIRRACEALGTWRLSGCTLFVTLEPCAMCAGACVNSRMDMVVFGAYEDATGCCISKIDLLDGAFLHTVRCVGGIMADECAAPLSGCFSGKRQKS